MPFAVTTCEAVLGPPTDISHQKSQANLQSSCMLSKTDLDVARVMSVQALAGSVEDIVPWV